MQQQDITSIQFIRQNESVIIQQPEPNESDTEVSDNSQPRPGFSSRALSFFTPAKTALTAIGLNASTIAVCSSIVGLVPAYVTTPGILCGTCGLCCSCYFGVNPLIDALDNILDNNRRERSNINQERSTPLDNSLNNNRRDSNISIISSAPSYQSLSHKAYNNAMTILSSQGIESKDVNSSILSKVIQENETMFKRNKINKCQQILEANDLLPPKYTNNNLTNHTSTEGTSRFLNLSDQEASNTIRNTNRRPSVKSNIVSL